MQQVVASLLKGENYDANLNFDNILLGFNPHVTSSLFSKIKYASFTPLSIATI
jgi:hypothetical protein